MKMRVDELRRIIESINRGIIANVLIKMMALSNSKDKSELYADNELVSVL